MGLQSANIPYSPPVAWLRAAAALLIVLYHGEQKLGALLATGKGFDPSQWHFTKNPLFALVLEGHTAVALFMVLSGFIFTWGTWQRTVDWRSFMVNRLLRIYPLYLVTIFIALILNPKAFALDGLVGMILPLADLKKIDGGPFVAMSWAIGVEFQFYALFPVLLVWLNRAPARTVGSVIALALTLRLLASGLGADVRDLSYWHLIGRIDEFMWGMGAAAWLRGALAADASAARLRARVVGVVGVVVAVAVVYAFHRHGGWPLRADAKLVWPTVEGAVWALVIVGVVGGQWAMPSLLSRALVWVGELSFSIYLLHFPIIDIVRRHPTWVPRWTGNASHDGLVATIVVVLPLTLAVAFLTWSVIEKPFLQLRRRYIHASSGEAGRSEQSVQSVQSVQSAPSAPSARSDTPSAPATSPSS